MIQELAVSSLRVWLFSPMILDLPISKLSQMLPIYAKTTTMNRVALRMSIFGWACSSWTKASLYLQKNHSIVNRRSSRAIGWIHLIIGSILLQAHKPKGASYFPSSYPHLKLMLKAFGCGGMGFIIDEFITCLVLLVMEKRYTIKGTGINIPESKEANNKSGNGSDECMICLTETRESLNSFCGSGHSAHPSCMEKWYQPVMPFSNCPLCRQKMDVSLKSIIHLGWLNQYSKDIDGRLLINLTSLILMSGVYSAQMYSLKNRLKVALGIS